MPAYPGLALGGEGTNCAGRPSNPIRKAIRLNNTVLRRLASFDSPRAASPKSSSPKFRPDPGSWTM